MKTNILKLFLFPLIMIITFVGCKKEDDLIGKTFIESYPINGGYKIHFIDSKKLILFRNEEQDEFNYEIKKKKISLTSVNNITTTHYFQIKNKNKFEIGYLRMHFPEDHMGNMIFQKE